MLEETKKLIAEGNKRVHRIKEWLYTFTKGELNKEQQDKIWDEFKAELTSAYQRGRLSQSKAFMKDMKFWDWFNMNLIYCQNTHSFVHRLYNLKDKWKTHHDAQEDAFKVIKDMEKAYQNENGN